MNINIDKIQRIPMQERYEDGNFYINRKLDISICKSILHWYFDFPKHLKFDLLICNKPFECSYKIKLSDFSSNIIYIDCSGESVHEWLMFNPTEIVSEKIIYVGIEY